MVSSGRRQRAVSGRERGVHRDGTPEGISCGAKGSIDAWAGWVVGRGDGSEGGEMATVGERREGRPSRGL